MPGGDWNYADDSELGPSEWARRFQAGKHQSPINILVDFRDLHQAACSQCAAAGAGNGPHQQQSRQLCAQLERALKLATGEELSAAAAAKSRRSHLDSVGDDELEKEFERERADSSNRSPSSSSNKSSARLTDDDELAAGAKRWACAPHSPQRPNEAQPHDERRPHLHKSSHHKHHHHNNNNNHNHHHHHHHQHQHHDATAQAAHKQRQRTRYCVTNKKIFLGYPRYLNSVRLSNTGHAWQVDLAPELAGHTLLCGPPLGEREYRLAQFHCHWGEHAGHGSEHQINGLSYAAELHFVHWNCSQFQSAEEAARHKHGLAVLGVFLQAHEGEAQRNKHLDKLMAGLRQVSERPQTSVELQDTRLDLKKLFPSNRWDYATYEGSLTTPPLSEVVDWLVFLQPVECSASQVAEFRRLRCPEGSLVKNCRPVQELNERTVTIWTHSHAH